MSKKQKKHSPQPKQVKVEAKSRLQRLEAFFERRLNLVAYILMGVSVLVSLLLFDVKISVGGDDSAYIERAWMFLDEGRYPFYQGPAYPLFLSLIVKLFGVKVVLMKFFSLIFYNLHVWFIFLAFRKRIPAVLCFALLFFLAINSYMQYYSSQTYTEGYFLFLQSIAIWLVMKVIDIMNDPIGGWVEGFKKHYGLFIATGLLFFVLTQAKSIAIICIVPVLLFFLLHKKYKLATYIFVPFLLFRTFYQFIIGAMYTSTESGQFEQILRKDLYKPELGHEDFAGLVERFLNNFNTYLSLHTWRIFHFHAPETGRIIPAVAFFTFVGILIFTIMSFRRNKYVFFASLYAVVLCSGIFAGIQANNMQDRLIIIVIPFVFLLLLYGLMRIAELSRTASPVFFIMGGILLFLSLYQTVVKAQTNTTTLKKNLDGDLYYGYTPDWENFLKMSKWCADSLPANSYVASRKASMSFIESGGKKFHGVYTVFTANPDSVLMHFKENKVTHIIIASLRRNPKKNDGYVINTFQRLFYPVAQKYPQKLRRVKLIGNMEPAECFEILYDK